LARPSFRLNATQVEVVVVVRVLVVKAVARQGLVRRASNIVVHPQINHVLRAFTASRDVAKKHPDEMQWRQQNHSARRGLAVVAVLVALIAACGSEQIDTSSTGGPELYACSSGFQPAVSDIFATSCSSDGCHGAVEPAVGLDLVSAGVEKRLIEQPAASCDATLVVPGNPAQSFLYEKIVASSPQCGDPMPIGVMLDDAKLACVRKWIAELPAGCETCGGSGCADLANDPAHCGQCNVVCPSDASCANGMCVCGSGATLCSGACIDPLSDSKHCGGCNQPCGVDLVCSAGACKAGCDAGLSKCGTSCVDTQTDGKNCGGCGVVCGANEICTAGVCGCGPGIDTKTDPNNCGACKVVCPPGQQCVDGKCACGNASVSFAANVQPIFDKSCAKIGCHRGAKPKEGLDLTAANSHANLLGAPAKQCSDGRMLVVPGDPANSYLVQKMLGVSLCSGTKMPKMGSVATQDVQAVSNWICAGAMNN